VKIVSGSTVKYHVRLRGTVTMVRIGHVELISNIFQFVSNKHAGNLQPQQTNLNEPAESLRVQCSWVVFIRTDNKRLQLKH